MLWCVEMYCSMAEKHHTYGPNLNYDIEIMSTHKHASCQLMYYGRYNSL